MAKECPEYVKHAVMYQLFLRAFTPEGTINAATKLLPHLADIGVDIVYLCPVTTADDDLNKANWSKRQLASGIENPCNPYRVKDYYDIDPEYGNEEDFFVFVKTAHQLGMRVMLDVVYMHCGPKANIIAEHPEFVKRDTAGNIITNEYNFPLINFDNDEVREYFLDNLLYFVENFGVDGYRADCASRVPVDFWEKARLALEELNPDITMLAESESAPLHAEAFDLSYAFSWQRAANQAFENEAPASAVKDAWIATNDRMKENLPRFIRCFENHDIVSDDHDNRIEKRRPREANDAELLLLFTIDGIPFVYNGQEIADATRISIWSNRFHSHNQCINWSKLLTGEGKARLEFFKQLTALRHESDILATGDTIWVDNSTPEQVISFLRMPAIFSRANECDCEDHCDCEDDCEEEDFDDDDCEATSSILVVINASDKPLATSVKVGLERGTLFTEKMVRGASYKSNDDEIKVNLLPYGFLVLEF